MSISVLGGQDIRRLFGSLEHKGAGHTPVKVPEPKADLPIVTMTSMVQLGKAREVFSADATQKLHARFIQSSISHMQRINKDSARRLAQCRALAPDADPAVVDPLLKEGFWYTQDHYEALVKFKKTKRQDLYVRSGNSFHGYAHPEFFEGIRDDAMPSKRKMCTFKAKADILPTVALAKLNGGLVIADCGTATSLSACLAVHDLIGPAKFNRIQPFCLGDGMATPLFKHLYDCIDIKSDKDLQPGDHCYFTNIEGYSTRHPFGYAAGFNVIYMGNGLFTGLLGETEEIEGVTAEDLEKIMWEARNAEPAPKGFLRPDIEAFVLRGHQDAPKVPDKISWDAFKAAKGFHPNLQGEPMQGKMLLNVHRPNLKNIERLAQASEEDVAQVFQSFWKEKEIESLRQLLNLKSDKAEDFAQ